MPQALELRSRASAFPWRSMGYLLMSRLCFHQDSQCGEVPKYNMTMESQKINAQGRNRGKSMLGKDDFSSHVASGLQEEIMETE